jgi:hypothetical protein
VATHKWREKILIVIRKNFVHDVYIGNNKMKKSKYYSVHLYYRDNYGNVTTHGSVWTHSLKDAKKTKEHYSSDNYIVTVYRIIQTEEKIKI